MKPARACTGSRRRNTSLYGTSPGSSQIAPHYYDDYGFKKYNVKVTCSSKDIAGAVGAASKIVNAHTTVPILSNVLLSADGDSVRVRATDLELTLEQSFPAEVQESGSVTVPAKLFSGYLGNLSPGIVELSGTPTRASVKCERSNYDFHALPPEEYPPLPSAAKRHQLRR